jgi:hypothetical protein
MVTYYHEICQNIGRKGIFLSFVVVLKLGGLGAVGVGTWRLTDDEKVITDAVDFVLDPFIILCIIGTITFIIAFLGCVGAIREHSLMLKSVSYNNFYSQEHFYTAKKIRCLISQIFLKKLPRIIFQGIKRNVCFLSRVLYLLKKKVHRRL